MGTMPPLRREPTRPKAASVPQAAINTRLPQRPYLPRGSDATRWAVTASRSDGPTHAPNNTGNARPY